MAEPGLSLGYPEIRRSVGRFLGYGSDPTSWTADQVTEVGDHIAAGLRRFYGFHKWQFLSPKATITTVASQADYDLADNFQTIIDRVTFAPANGAWWTVPVVPDATIRHFRQVDDTSGKPRMVSVVPAVSTGVEGSRYTLTMYPQPDAVYVVTFRMLIQPDTLDATHPYPMGGTVHAETILECILAAAENTMDDAQGVHSAKAAELLLHSVRMDNATSSVGFLGYNGDSSDQTNPARGPDRFRRVSIVVGA